MDNIQHLIKKKINQIAYFAVAHEQMFSKKQSSFTLIRSWMVLHMKYSLFLQILYLTYNLASFEY